MKKTIFLTLIIFVSTLLHVSCSNSDEITNQTDVTVIGISVAIDAVNEMDISTGLNITSSSTPTAKQA
ncbi:hypothetical protein [Flavobacterium sp.]|uniref:hypothetical protein n=1 Tax=Flavobacterium sp. TaxID=239 RepID=UPI003267440C